MSIRIRADNKTLVCAAKSEEMPGDLYIDDGLHYCLSVLMKVLSVCDYDDNCAELWEFHEARDDYSDIAPPARCIEETRT